MLVKVGVLRLLAANGCWWSNQSLIICRTALLSDGTGGEYQTSALTDSSGRAGGRLET